jgi:hypothetical protein
VWSSRSKTSTGTVTVVYRLVPLLPRPGITRAPSTFLKWVLVHHSVRPSLRAASFMLNGVLISLVRWTAGPPFEFCSRIFRALLSNSCFVIHVLGNDEQMGGSGSCGISFQIVGCVLDAVALLHSTSADWPQQRPYWFSGLTSQPGRGMFDLNGADESGPSSRQRAALQFTRTRAARSRSIRASKSEDKSSSLVHARHGRSSYVAS